MELSMLNNENDERNPGLHHISKHLKKTMKKFLTKELEKEFPQPWAILMAEIYFSPK